MIVYLGKPHCTDKNLNIMYSSLLNYMIYDILELELTVE